MGSLLAIIKNFIEFLNREAKADEKIKDEAVRIAKHNKCAIGYAKQMFIGNRKFKGLDILLADKLDPKDYKEYQKLRTKFNKFS